MAAILDLITLIQVSLKSYHKTQCELYRPEFWVKDTSLTVRGRHSTGTAVVVVCECLVPHETLPVLVRVKHMLCTPGVNTRHVRRINGLECLCLNQLLSLSYGWYKCKVSLQQIAILILFCQFNGEKNTNICFD